MNWEPRYEGVHCESTARKFSETQFSHTANGVNYYHCWTKHNPVDNPLPDDGKLRVQEVVRLNRLYRDKSADFELHDPITDQP